MSKPFSEVLRRFGLQDFQPLRSYLDAVCQITVQASSDEAEAPFALAAMDYFFRGTGHVVGGIGVLAWELVHAFERLGGDLFLTDHVTSLEREDGLWNVQARRRTVRSRTVVANLLPATIRHLTNQSTSQLEAISEAVENGWGAAMLYLGLTNTDTLPPPPFHLELIHEESRPCTPGNHVFVSVGAPDESKEGSRGVTASTHIDMRTFRDLSSSLQAAHITEVQEAMRRTIELRAPELHAAIEFEMTASPRTFERFTGRPNGCVGGIPRRYGLHNYRNFYPGPILDDLYMVSDSVFPGQSTLAASIGGLKTAQVILRAVAPTAVRSLESKPLEIAPLG